MDIGSLESNYTFYEGHEDENEIVLHIEMDGECHQLEGVFSDILV